jgi:excinuclease ABC subunit A
MLHRLRDLGNTVIVVEHDADTIRAADYVVDIGPGAGIKGGRITAVGTPAEITANPASLTGQYLSAQRCISLPKRRLKPKRWLHIRKASGHNLRHIDAAIPLGVLTCVTGVSGSGKSTLINTTLYRYIARELNGATALPAPCQAVEGLDQIDKIITIDQRPIGRTPRSNPATYTGLFEPIRELFAATPEARSRGYTPGRFSFNVKGGRCEACQGDGVIRVAMPFMPDADVPCDVCHGQRFNRETLQVTYKGCSIADILALSVEQAQGYFKSVPAINQRLQTLIAVGLGYLSLGQSATTLSGGEAQRVKLARELARRDTGNTLYILDEPTTGLHFQDIEQLLQVLWLFRDRGNTLVIIEHHLDVIKTADWIIDLGPEGGQAGGDIIAAGTPEQVAACPHSHTGQFLRPLLTHIAI